MDLVSVVSHDLQNPLHIAQMRLELAQEDCESDHLSKRSSHGIVPQPPAEWAVCYR